MPRYMPKDAEGRADEKYRRNGGDQESEAEGSA
jgi:hypothetical protein